MRLNKFKQLSIAEQKKEVEKAKQEIQLAYEKLCKMGNWNKNVTKELKEKGEATLWEFKREAT